jgi:caa(3)-type oxidase subunit IV
LGLTIAEVAVAYAPVPKLTMIILLVGMAFTKAALVALYFMHLKFERSTLTLIALTPLILCVFLSLMLLPDIHP